MMVYAGLTAMYVRHPTHARSLKCSMNWRRCRKGAGSERRPPHTGGSKPDGDSTPSPSSARCWSPILHRRSERWRSGGRSNRRATCCTNAGQRSHRRSYALCDRWHAKRMFDALRSVLARLAGNGWSPANHVHAGNRVWGKSSGRRMEGVIRDSCAAQRLGYP